MSAPKIQVYQDTKRRWRWRCVAGNGEQISKSPGGCNLRTSLDSDLAQLKQQGESEFYEDARGKRRWRMTYIANNKTHVGAVSSQGYVSGDDASKALRLTKQAIADI